MVPAQASSLWAFLPRGSSRYLQEDGPFALALHPAKRQGLEAPPPALRPRATEISSRGVVGSLASIHDLQLRGSPGWTELRKSARRSRLAARRDGEAANLRTVQYGRIGLDGVKLDPGSFGGGGTSRGASVLPKTVSMERDGTSLFPTNSPSSDLAWFVAESTPGRRRCHPKASSYGSTASAPNLRTFASSSSLEIDTDRGTKPGWGIAGGTTPPSFRSPAADYVAMTRCVILCRASSGPNYKAHLRHPQVRRRSIGRRSSGRRPWRRALQMLMVRYQDVCREVAHLEASLQAIWTVTPTQTRVVGHAVLALLSTKVQLRTRHVPRGTATPEALAAAALQASAAAASPWGGPHRFATIPSRPSAAAWSAAISCSSRRHRETEAVPAASSVSDFARRAAHLQRCEP
eukprot:scaffold890_cov269-Pinguiococcus_pyrenoidosus.AAC.12